MALNVSRRGLIGMFAAGVGAAIVRPGLLMPVKPALLTMPRDIVLTADLGGKGWFIVTGKDAYGNSIVETIRGAPGYAMSKIQFASVSSMVWA